MDSFINKLTEEFAIKLADYTVFDIANPSDGLYYTNKISYETLLSQLSGDIYKRLKALLDALQSNLNTANANIARKLDKQGLNFSPTERMTGPLAVNATLCATGISYFTNLVTVRNNFISDVRDPVLDQDAVNLRTLSAAIAALNIPRGSDYIRKSGDTMTGGFITAASDFPTADRHLATKIYVDQEVGKVNTRINGLDFVRKSGDTMTGALYLPLSAPTHPTEATNKEYVDTKFSSIVIPSTVGFVRRSGDTMTGSLFLTGNPMFDDEASNKRYVDSRFNSIVIPDVSLYIRKSGDIMTGGNLTLSAEPTIPKHATTKFYVDKKFDDITATYATKIYVDTTFVKKSGDSMTGSLMLTGDPRLANEAANKNYVDFRIQSLAAGFATIIYVDSTFLKKTGDTMTAGNLTLSAEPTIPKHATTKKYVDDEIDKIETKIDDLSGTYVKKAGDTMTGNLNIRGFTEAYGVIENGSGSVTLPVALSGNTYHINVTGDINDFNVTGVDANRAITINLFIKSDAASDVAWNFKVNGGAAFTAKWGGPSAPVLSKSNVTDVYTFTRVLTTWYGFVGGQGFN